MKEICLDLEMCHCDWKPRRHLFSSTRHIPTKQVFWVSLHTAKAPSDKSNEHVTSQWKLRKRRCREGIEQFIKATHHFSIFIFLYISYKTNSYKHTFIYNEKRGQMLTSLVSTEQMEPEASRGEEIETNTVVMVSLSCSKHRDSSGQWKPPLGKTTCRSFLP